MSATRSRTVRPRPGLVLASTVLLALIASGTAGCVAGSGSADAPQKNSIDVREKAVEAPAGGTIEDTVESVEPGETVDVSLDESAELPGGVSVQITDTGRLDVPANTPGEIAGPVVAVTVRIVNNTSESIDLGSTVVTLTGADGAFGQPTTAGPFDPFTGAADSGKSLNATYVFASPPAGTLQLSVSYAGGAPTALFVGEIS